ncbi:hypothetical protein BDY24DRAFT_380879 [Mrakia frigida]|uniref:uncharacterized protein n=1 Tax=Mrakia frigida TaxID=29902 RepID=UPI003FCC0F03
MEYVPIFTSSRIPSKKLTVLLALFQLKFVPSSSLPFPPSSSLSLSLTSSPPLFFSYLEPLTGDSSPLPPPASISSKLTNSSSSSPSKPDPAIRAKEKAEEYERLCGESWKEYKECVWKGVSKKGLTTLIESARLENPLVSIDSPVGEAQSSAAAKK